MVYNPKVFHLSDGDSFSEKDVHYNLGKGDFRLAEFLSIVPDSGLLTIETPRDPLKGFEDFINDINFLNELFREKK